MEIRLTHSDNVVLFIGKDLWFNTIDEFVKSIEIIPKCNTLYIYTHKDFKSWSFLSTLIEIVKGSKKIKQIILYNRLSFLNPIDGKFINKFISHYGKLVIIKEDLYDYEIGFNKLDKINFRSKLKELR